MTELKIIDQSHLLSGTPFEDNVESYVHPSQENKRKVKVRLYFWIGPIREDDPIENVDPDSKVLRLASCRIPKGCPVSKVRDLVNHMEKELAEIYKTVRRANLVEIANEDSQDYKISFDLPLYGVYYV